MNSGRVMDGWMDGWMDAWDGVSVRGEQSRANTFEACHIRGRGQRSQISMRT